MNKFPSIYIIYLRLKNRTVLNIYYSHKHTHTCDQTNMVIIIIITNI